MSGDQNVKQNKLQVVGRSKLFWIAGVCLLLIFIIGVGVERDIILKPTEHTAFAEPFIPSTPEKTAIVLIVGDIMLDRNVRNTISRIGFDTYFAQVRDLISSADLAVGNLEGPFTSHPSRTASLTDKALVFTFDPELAPKLAHLGFDVLGLANNHTLNFGHDGLATTRAHIHAAHMISYGDPDNSDRTSSSSVDDEMSDLSAVVDVNGIRVGIVGFHEFVYRDFDRVLAEIDRIRPDVDVLIVTSHWGVEYQKTPTTLMKKYAHLFIDHGADVVVGGHPHVVGDREEYMGKQIFYSLGNFAFDQYFSEETMRGEAVRITIRITMDSTTISPDISFDFETIPVHVGREGVSVIETP